MTDIKTMSPATGEVITKTGEVVNLVDVLGGATPVDETLYDIESYSPRTGLIIGSDGKAYDLVDLLQGGGSGGGDVSREEFESLEGRVDDIGGVILDTVEPLQKQVDKTDDKVDALWKLSQGMVYDFKEEVEKGISDAPAGAKYMTLEDVQGDTRQENYHMGLAVDTGKITGCAEAPIRELQMFGKTEQKTTNGYNLYNPINFIKSTISGITFERNEDGSCSVKGTSTGYVGYGAWEVFLPAGEYYIGAEIVSGTLQYISTFRARVFAEDATYRDYGVGKTFVLDVETKVRMFFQVDAAWDPIDVTLFPYVCLASAPHIYEPYTGGIPSPNPDYPQQINSIEEIKVCASNNLFNPLDYYSQKKFKSSENSAVWWSTHYLPNGNYIVKTNIAVSGGNSAVFATTTYKETPSTGGSGVNGSRNITVTKGVLYIGMYGVTASGTPHVNSAKTIDFDTYMKEGVEVIIQREDDEINQASVNYAFIAPPQPLNAIGENKDVCDVERGEWEYNTIIFNADDWNLAKNTGTNGEYYLGTKTIDSYARANNASDEDVICEMFRGTTSSAAFNGLRTFINATGDFRFSYPNHNDIEEVRQAIHGMKAVFRAGHSIHLPIAETDLAFLRSLRTYPTTNVYITDQLGRDISSQFRFLREGSEDANDVVAPTPLYPSELHSVEKIKVKVSGKNLLKNGGTETVTSYGVTYRRNPDGSVHAKGTATANSFYGLYGENRLSWTGIPDWYEKDKTYFCKDCAIQIMTPAGILRTPIDTKFNAYDEGVTGVYIFCRVPKGETVDKTFYPQIEFGEKATSYEPYQEEVRSIVPPKALNHVGDYVDVANIDKGVWQYRLDRCDLNEVTSWAIMDSENWFYKRFASPHLPKDFLNGDLVKCNIAIGGYNLYGRTTLRISNYQAYFFADMDTLEEWTAFLKNTDAYFIAPLEIEVEEPINPDDLAFLRSLELLPADHHITITDQDGNDVSYLLEYIIKLSDVVAE